MTLTQLFTAIANAIRGKKGTQAPIVAENFPSEIASIVTEPNLQSKSVTITENGTTNVSADTGYDGLSGVEVVTNVPIPEDFTINDARSLFADNARANAMNELIARFEKVTNTDSMFSRFKKFTAPEYLAPFFDMSEVTSMNFMFYQSNVHKLPAYDTSKVTSMRNVFESVHLIEAPEMDTSSVTDMSGIFADNSSLKKMPLYNTSKVTNMGGAFRYVGSSLDDESKNNILKMCINATLITSTSYKTLKYLGITQATAQTFTTLPDYQAFLDAGWTTGY